MARTRLKRRIGPPAPKLVLPSQEVPDTISMPIEETIPEIGEESPGSLLDPFDPAEAVIAPPIIPPEEEEDLLSRMTGKVTGLFTVPKSMPKKRVKKSQEDLRNQLAPLASMLLIFGFHMLTSPKQKHFVPTSLEADLITKPLINILSRQIEIRTKINEDTLDILACLTATATYGYRVYRENQAIKKEEAAHEREREYQRHTSGHSANGAGTFVVTGEIVGPHASGNGDGSTDGIDNADGKHVHSPDSGGSVEQNGSADQWTRELLARDSEWRRQRGYN